MDCNFNDLFKRRMVLTIFSKQTEAKPFAFNFVFELNHRFTFFYAPAL